MEEQDIIKTALKEYYDRKYKLYNSTNNLPVTDEEFEDLRKKSAEIKAIRDVATKYEAI